MAHGRARKRAARPKRDILAVKTALSILKLRYCQEVSFWNDQYMGAAWHMGWLSPVG